MGRDAQPTRWILRLLLLTLAGLAYWFVTLPAPVRLARLSLIARHEQASTLPPSALLAQGEWLVRHRLRWVQQCGAFVLLAGGIGLCEGLAARRRQLRAGFGLWSWTLGLVGLWSVVALVIAGLCLPRPLALLPVSLGLSLATALGVFALSAGRPSLP